MSILLELNRIVDGLGILVETGVFKDKAPDEYVVITPLADTFDVHADNRPQFEIQEARLSLFSKITIKYERISLSVRSWMQTLP